MILIVLLPCSRLHFLKPHASIIISCRLQDRYKFLHFCYIRSHFVRDNMETWIVCLLLSIQRFIVWSLSPLNKKNALKIPNLWEFHNNYILKNVSNIEKCPLSTGFKCLDKGVLRICQKNIWLDTFSHWI